MRYDSKTFSAEHVPLDGNEFVHCHFLRCTLVYSGGPPPTLDGCSFGTPTFKFVGTAGDTLAFLHSLYHGGFKTIVEGTIDNIRKP